MNKRMRAQRILELLTARQHATAAELQRELGVSAPTVYRDIRELELRNLVATSHGGVELPSASLKVDESANARFLLRLTRNPQSKRQIAEKALRLVRDDDIVFADSSTTVYHFVKALLEQHCQFSSLTIITNSSAILRELISPPPSITLIALGGVYNAQLSCFLGRMTLNALQQVHITKAFVSAAAVSVAEACTFHEHHAEFLGEVLRHADQTYLLADHSKFDTRAVFCISRTPSFTGVITDDAVSSDLAAKYAAAGVNMMTHT